MVYWTAKNNSSFLNTRRSARTMRAAVIDARRYLRGELCGEGQIDYYENPGDVYPIRTDRCDIFTGWQWQVDK